MISLSSELIFLNHVTGTKKSILVHLIYWTVVSGKGITSISFMDGVGGGGGCWSKHHNFFSHCMGILHMECWLFIYDFGKVKSGDEII